jgi:hypothetical protein
MKPGSRQQMNGAGCQTNEGERQCSDHAGNQGDFRDIFGAARQRLNQFSPRRLMSLITCLRSGGTEPVQGVSGKGAKHEANQAEARAEVK